MKVSAVLGAASKKVVPDVKERRRVGGVAGSLLVRTKAAAKRHPEVRGVILGGSYAKDTWLPGEVDVDIFVKIDPSVSGPRFEELGLEIGERVAAGYPRGKKYAQHPYTEATIEGVKANIVPCYDVKRGAWLSAADRSPYHVTLVEGLSREKKLEVRLLKRFMKGVGVYGAEIEKQGFSGYVAEVLVLRNGSFLDVVRLFSGFRPPSDDGLLIALPDPVDEGRDLGRAVSSEKLARMILASREFLRRPSLAYFMGLKGRRRPRGLFDPVVILFSHSMLSEDTLWGELKKALRDVQRKADEEGFTIARSFAATDGISESAFLFIPEMQALPRLEQRLGPTVDRKSAASAFISANERKAKLVWVDAEGRLRILQERQHRQFIGYLEEAIKGGSGAKGVSSGMKRSGKVLKGKELSEAASSRPWLARGLDEIVSDTPGAGTA